MLFGTRVNMSQMLSMDRTHRNSLGDAAAGNSASQDRNQAGKAVNPVDCHRMSKCHRSPKLCLVLNVWSSPKLPGLSTGAVNSRPSDSARQPHRNSDHIGDGLSHVSARA